MNFADGKLPDREQFEHFILSLPSVEIVHQWGNASVGKVGGKIFAIWGMAGADLENHLSFKCSDLSFEMLPELDNIKPAKYLARAKWVDVTEGSPLTAKDIAAYVTEAHRLVALKLPARIKDALGLASD